MADATFADLFAQWRSGEGSAQEAIFSQYLDDLTALAKSLMRRERVGGAVSISTGDLVGETMIRLLGGKPVEPTDMHHLMALSASAMRRFLVDRARARHAGKRRGLRVTLNEELVGKDVRPIELLAVDEALSTLDDVAPEPRPSVRNVLLRRHDTRGNRQCARRIAGNGAAFLHGGGRIHCRVARP